LWKSANEETNNRAAECLALTARRNLENGLVDAVIREPLGGAHRDPRASADALSSWIVDHLRELSRVNPEALVRQRLAKFRKMGAFRDELSVTTA
jgi:acetyl-CoA carboxylase carboxyl transferase subunit alpha